MNQYQKTKRKKKVTKRKYIEAKFGQLKNGYNLNKIRAKLEETSESWINCIFSVINLINHQKKVSFVALFYEIFNELESFLKGGNQKNKKTTFMRSIWMKNLNLSFGF